MLLHTIDMKLGMIDKVNIGIFENICILMHIIEALQHLEKFQCLHFMKTSIKFFKYICISITFITFFSSYLCA